MLIGTVALIVVAVGLGYVIWPLALITVPVLVWLFAFFRDPEREIPIEQHVMVSPQVTTTVGRILLGLDAEVTTL